VAVTTSDNRTTLDAADAVTNFNQGDQNTTDFAEANASVSLAINIGTDQLFFNGTIPNFTTLGNELIYIWSANNATQNAFDGGGTGADASHAMYFDDGTNEVIAFMAGNDLDQFKHAETQVLFQCMLFDADHVSEADAAGRLHAIAGTAGNIDMTALNSIGMYYVTLSKALAGGYNTFIDMIRYGGRDDGIQIAGGTTGDRGSFDEIAAVDRSTTSDKAHGIIREYTANTFGCQGTLRFGDTGTASTYFDATSQSVTWEDRLVDDDKFALFVDANATGTNVFNLSGCALSSAGPGVLIDMTDAEINELQIDACTFTNLLNAISFPTDTNGTTRDHDVTNNTFNVCGQIDPGTVVFTGNTITDTTDLDGAVLLDADGSADWSDLTFNYGDGTGSPVVGHAIYIPTGVTGSFDFTSFTYTGYGANGSSTAALFNDSGNEITINVLGGDSPTVLNGAGSSTIINNPITFTVSNVQTNSEVRLYEAGTRIELAGTETQNGELTVANVNNGGTGYTVSDVLTIVGGTGTAGTITVTSVDGGVITGVSVTTGGDYTENPPSLNGVTVTGGTGSNATFDIVIGGTFTYCLLYTSPSPRD